MGFLVEKILVVKEVNGAIPANPMCIEIQSESFDLKETQSSEDINLFGAGGDASPKVFGVSSFGGGLGIVASTDNFPILCHHTIGDATISDATTEIWGSSVDYVVGDLVNHSDGKHTLSCYKGGTSDANEPVLDGNPSVDRGTKIIDGGATWIAMPFLKSYIMERKQQLSSFAIEITQKDENGNFFYKRFENVYSNSLAMAMTGSTISLKMSADFVSAKADDSESNTWTSNLLAMTGASIISLDKEFYGSEDCEVKFDGNALCGTESINLDMVRNVTVMDLINKCKTTDIGITGITGNMNRVFNTEDYKTYKEHTDFEVKFEFVKPNGCSAKFTYPFVKPSLADSAVKLDGQSFISPELSAYGKGDIQSVSAVIIAPALVDDTGNIYTY
ncbi:MAG: hypothetical protein JJV88_00300 [Sulfurovum sp.]|nr:hypothetical protein [Sulfurovaceae bacterium]